MVEAINACEIWPYAEGAKILLIRRADQAAIEAALRDASFDGIELTNAIQDFSCLENHSDKVYWLHAPAVSCANGLEKLSNVERITYVGDIHNEPFDYCRLPKLKELKCHLAGLMKREFVNHPEIEKLELEGLKVKDLTFLSKAKNLRALRLAVSPIKTLLGLHELSNLIELRLLHIRALQDISNLVEAKQLELLELEKTPNLTDISPIYSLHNLRWLYVDAKKARQARSGFINIAAAKS